MVRRGEVGKIGVMRRRGRMVQGSGRFMIGTHVELGGRRRLLHSEVAAFRLAVGRILVPHVLVDLAGLGTQPRWGWWELGAVPRVGHRTSGQPWAGGRNPVGIGRRVGREVRRVQ